MILKDIYNYFLETGDILYQYYDIQEKIQQGSEKIFSTKPASKPGSVLAALQEAAKKDNADDEQNQEEDETFEIKDAGTQHHQRIFGGRLFQTY